MHRESRRGRRFALAVIAVATAFAVAAPSGGAATFSRIQGFDDPATPDEFDKVGDTQGRVAVREEDPRPRAGNLRKRRLLRAARTGHREQDATAGRCGRSSAGRTCFEDHSMVDRVKRGEATAQQLFDYYLGWLTNPSVTEHFGRSDSSVPSYARGWGMRVAVEDLRRVIEEARAGSREVVLGGHSLGGSIATAYATWDFNGQPGADDLSGPRADRRRQRACDAHRRAGDSDARRASRPRRRG